MQVLTHESRVVTLKESGVATETELASALLKKLAEIVIGGDSVVGIEKDPRSFISFCYPGIAVDATDFDFSYVVPVGEKAVAAADFSALVNSIPSESARFLPTAEKITDIYAEIMRDKQLPQVNLTDSEKKQLAAAEALIIQEIEVVDDATGGIVKVPGDTPLYQKYKEYESAYYNAAAKLRELQARLNYRGDPESEALWALNGENYQAQVQSVFNTWSTLKGKVEQALGTIASLAGRGPEFYWVELLSRFNKSRLSTAIGESYHFTKYFPSGFWNESHAKGWTQFTMAHSEVHTINENSQMSASIGGGWSGGLWSVSGGGSYAEQKTSMESDTEGLNIDLQLTMVPIRRTWLDATIFSNRAWRLDPNINNSVYSDGATPADGKMPAIITGMILAREVSLGMNMTTERNSSFASQLAIKASGGFGPFRVKGSFSRNASRTTHDYVMSSAGINVPGMQIIGFICQRIPTCPNPDTSLNWPE